MTTSLQHSLYHRINTAWRAVTRTLFALGTTLLLAFGLASAVHAANPKLIITGASGKLGGEVLDFLSQRGVQPQDLILVTRSPDKLADWARRGAEVRRGDFTEPSTLPAAFAGGQRMLLISSGNLGPSLFTENQAAIEAAKRAGVKRIVYTSFVNAKKLGEIGVLPSHYQTEVALKNSGLKWIVLRNQDYMENTTSRARQIVAAGVLRSEDGKKGSVAHKDCAEAAVAALLTSGPENKVYEITGPALLGSSDVARTLSEVSGKQIRVEKPSTAPEATKPPQGPSPGATPGAGPSPEDLAFFAGLVRAQRNGIMAVLTHDFQTLTGHAPQSLRDVLETQRAELTGAAGPKP